MWILAKHGGIPELSSNYVANWRLLPNLAMDLIVPTLGGFMTVQAAGRLFIALTACLLVTGTMALHRALHGKVGLWPATTFLFVYNAALFWGFLNFLFGASLAMFALAGWFSTRHWKAVSRTALFSLIACLLLILHLFAFVLYGLCVVTAELGQRVRQKQLSMHDAKSLCVVCMQFLPGCVLGLVSIPASGPSFTLFGSLANKIYALESPFMFGQAPTLFDSIVVLSCLVFLIFVILNRVIILSPEMRLPLIAMAGVANVMPNTANGSWLADIRLPVRCPFFLIASSHLSAPHTWKIGRFAIVAIILLSIRVWSISQSWHDYDKLLTEFRMESEVITPGARLLVVTSPLPEDRYKIPQVSELLAKRQMVLFYHMPAFSVIDRSSFIPYLFTGWTTVTPTERNAGLYWTQGEPISPEDLAEGASAEPHRTDMVPNGLGTRIYWRDWPKYFDFVLWFDFGINPPAIDHLLALRNGSYFKIYRVIRP